MRRLAVMATAVAAAMALAVPPAGAADDASLTVEVSTPRQVDQPVTVSGDLTSASEPIVYPATVTLQRDRSAESTTVATDSAGHYTFTDTPDTRGAVTYTVSWIGDGAHPSGAETSTTVDVTGLSTSVELSARNRVVRSGRLAHLTAHLGGTATSRTVTIYAKPYDQARVRVARGETDPQTGDFTASFRLDRHTRFIARFRGDDRYEPARDRVRVRARSTLRERLRGGYDEAHGYRLYHPGADPSLSVWLHPVQNHACIYFRAQRRQDGRWRNSAVSSCVHTDGDGRARGVLTGDHIVGRPYRLRAETHRTDLALGSHGRWLRLKFHR